MATAPAAHPRMPHLRLTTEFAFAVARCDGKIARAEREVIRRHLHSAFGHEPELVRFINPLCEQYEKAAIDLDGCLGWAKRLFNGEEIQQLFRFAEAIADAAGKRTKKEKELLERLRKGLGIAKPAPRPAPPPAPTPAPAPAPPMKPEEPKQRPTAPPSVVECRGVLEIPADIALTADLVRRQYRLLRDRFDPARFESHGAEFIEVARRKLERIEAAARTLLAGMNEPLEVESAPDKPKDLRENPDLDAIFG